VQIKNGLRALVAAALVSAAATGAIGGASALDAPGPPAGFTASLVQGGLHDGVGGLPTAFAFAPDGRLFVARKTGVIDVYDGGVQYVFADLRDQVNSTQSRGLLGLALDPAFASNHRVFALFTQELDPANPDQGGPAGGEIVRLTQQSANPDAADLTSQLTLLSGYQSIATEHAVGALRFDAAGNLLASFGDATSLGVGDGAAMATFDLNDLRGKIVRINRVTGLGVAGNPYFDPAQPASVKSKVFARGFRNPYRFTIDPDNGTVYVGDVGWNTWEMLNAFPSSFANADRDRNAGWPCYEGGNGIALPQPDFEFAPATQAACQAIYSPDEGGTGVGVSAPLYGYRHDDPGGENGSAITAGPKYVGTSNYPAQYVGQLFIGDYARDRFQTVDPQTGVATDFGVAGGWGNPVDISIAPDGNVVYLAIGASEIREIVYTGSNHVPVPVASATSTSSATAPFTAQFNGSASSDADPGDTLTYDWNFADGGAHSNLVNPSHLFAAAGSYDVTLTVSDGHPGGTVETDLWIDVANTPPTVSLTSPASSLRYSIGDTISVGLNAQDAEDGALTGTAVSSQIRLIHLGHFHPVTDFTGTSASFTVEDHGSDDTYYEVITTATDHFGRSTTQTFDILPNKQPVSITSSPPGAVVSVDGVQATTPYNFMSIVNGHHEVDAPADLALPGDPRTFDRWTQGSTEAFTEFFTFNTPATGTALDAGYTPTTKGISVGDASIVEGDSGSRTATVAVSLSVPSTVPVSVDYTTVDGAGSGGATAPSDYAARSGTLTFAPGATLQSITVPVNGDVTGEGDEHFAIVLSNANGAPIVSGTGTVTIIDDDPGTGLRVSVGDLAMLEGDAGARTVTATVSLSAPSPGGVSVRYTTADASAASPTDFVAKSGTVTFAANKTTAAIKIAIQGDGTFEPSEAFAIDLSNPVGAVLGRAVGTVRLANDDPGPALSVGDVSTVEGDSGGPSVFFAVSLSTPSSLPVTVDYTVAHQTTNDGDLKTKPGTVTIAPGKLSATFQVKTYGDTAVEPDETYRVTLSDPVNAVIARATATGTLLNDDPGSGLRASVGDASISEGNSGQRQLVFTVTLSQPAATTVNVSYATASQTATAGVDFTARTGTVKIAAGKQSVDLPIVVRGDALPEPDETFTLHISAPTGGAVLGRASATGTILNDD
jgi:glucose/arabinose dehydrogenase